MAFFDKKWPLYRIEDIRLFEAARERAKAAKDPGAQFAFALLAHRCLKGLSYKEIKARYFPEACCVMEIYQMCRDLARPYIEAEAQNLMPTA